MCYKLHLAYEVSCCLSDHSKSRLTPRFSARTSRSPYATPCCHRHNVARRSRVCEFWSRFGISGTAFPCVCDVNQNDSPLRSHIFFSEIHFTSELTPKRGEKNFFYASDNWRRRSRAARRKKTRATQTNQTRRQDLRVWNKTKLPVQPVLWTKGRTWKTRPAR
jgi:hypothetical protein